MKQDDGEPRQTGTSFNRPPAGKKFFSPNRNLGGLNTSLASFSNLATSPVGIRLLNIPSIKIIETAITKGKELIMSEE